MQVPQICWIIIDDKEQIEKALIFLAVEMRLGFEFIKIFFLPVFHFIGAQIV